MKLWGYSRLIVELRWPFLLFHIIRMIRNREEEKEEKRNGRKEEEEEAEGGKKKRMRRPSPLLSATDSLRSLHAGLASPDGTAPTGWRQIKRKKKKKVKTGIRRLLGEKKEKRPGGTAGQRGSSSRRTGGCCWGVRSFGSTPSNIIYAPIIFPHVHTHERVYTYVGAATL